MVAVLSNGRDSDFVRERRSEDAALRAHHARKSERIGHRIVVWRLDTFGVGYRLVRGVNEETGEPCLTREAVA